MVYQKKMLFSRRTVVIKMYITALKSILDSEWVINVFEIEGIISETIKIIEYCFKLLNNVNR